MKVALTETKDFHLTITYTRDGEVKTGQYHAFACRSEKEAIQRAKESGKDVKVLEIKESQQ